MYKFNVTFCSYRLKRQMLMLQLLEIKLNETELSTNLLGSYFKTIFQSIRPGAIAHYIKLPTSMALLPEWENYLTLI